MKIKIGNKNGYLKRINEILKVLKKNDFGYLIEEKSVLPKFPFLRNKEKAKELDNSDETIPIRIRKVIEDLGPAYIKLGQMLSSRPDLVGIEIAKELEKLTDNTPITPFDKILELIEIELKQDPMEVFESIDETPLGSASIGQVHKGILKETGKEVAIKIQKPRTEELIKSDVKIMKFLANKTNRYIRQIKIFNLPVIVEEFERTILKEIDYHEELLNMQILSQNMKTEKYIHIPNVYPEYSTERLIVMELIKGIEMTKIINSEEPIPNIDKKLIGKRGAKAYFKQVILDGFFHADPHPGNLIIMEDNVVCFIDEGMMGNLTEEFRKDLAHLLLTLTSGNATTILNQLEYMDIITHKQITPELKEDVHYLVSRYYKTNISNDKGVIEDLFNIMIKHNVKIPKEFVNIGRGISLIENIGQTLDPSFNPEEEIKKLSKKIVLQRYSPKEVMNNILNFSREIEHLGTHLPDQINDILTKIETGEITVKIEIQSIEELIDKISFALIIAALIIGSSFILLKDVNNWIGLIGFILSGCLGGYVILKHL